MGMNVQSFYAPGYSPSEQLNRQIQNNPQYSAQQNETYWRQNQPQPGQGGGMNPFYASSAFGNGTSGQYGSGPFNPFDPQGLVAMQMSENERARNLNQSNWEGARGDMKGVLGGYDSDPLIAQSRQNALSLMQNPEAINDQVQGMMLAKQGNMANANAQAQMEAAQNAMINNGQGDSSSQQATMNKLNNQRMTQLMSGQSDLEIQRAVRRNQDIQSATQLGNSIGNQRAQLNFGINNSILNNLPQHRPDNYAGLIGALGKQGPGASGGVNLRMGQFGVGGNFGTKRSTYAGDGLGGFTQPGQESLNPFYGMRPTDSYFGGGTQIQSMNNPFANTQKKTNYYDPEQGQAMAAYGM